MRCRSFEKLTRKELFTVWHLLNMGVEDPKEIHRYCGVRVHINSFDSIREVACELLQGPFTLKEPIRCPICGARLLYVPCLSCVCKGRYTYGQHNR